MTPYDIDLALTWLRNAGQCAVAPLGDDLVSHKDNKIAHA
jgi:hypothetical protein